METEILKVKKRLIEKIKKNMNIDEVIEWIWEEYGVKTRNWEQVEKFLLKKEVRLSEILTLMTENDIEITDEDLKELL
ncbi:MAG: hypothetical protein P3X22_007710 [Thermoprotei archaeon]|nr:hypothetical protein [Thermoprotei archaeon]